MISIPFATNPNTGISIGGLGGTFTNLRSCFNPRVFTDSEHLDVVSHIHVDLPTALHGMTGSYKVGDIFILLSIKEKPMNVAAYNIGLPQISPELQHMKLEPDIHGIVNYTEVVLSFKGYHPIDSPHDADSVFFTNSILRKIVEPLNVLIDAYCLTTKIYDIEQVTPKDFIYCELWHSIANDSITYNRTFIQFPSATVSFEGPEKEGEMTLMKKVVALTAMPETYFAASRLFAEGHRALNRHDYDMAAILAISSIETALSHYINFSVLRFRDKENAVRISNNSIKDLQDKLSVAIELKILLPLLLPQDWHYPKEDVDLVDRLRKSRNEAIHDPFEFNKRMNSPDIAKGVIAAGNLLVVIMSAHASAKAQDKM